MANNTGYFISASGLCIPTAYQDSDFFNTITLSMTAVASGENGSCSFSLNGTVSASFTRIPFVYSEIYSIPAGNFMLATGDGGCCQFPLNLFGSIEDSFNGETTPPGNPLSNTYSDGCGTVSAGPASGWSLTGSLGVDADNTYTVGLGMAFTSAMNYYTSPKFCNAGVGLSTSEIPLSSLLGTHSFSTTLAKPPGTDIDSTFTTVSVSLSGSIAFS
jgi:hypothetical protein